MRVQRQPPSLTPPCAICPRCQAEICGTLADIKNNKEGVSYVSCPSCHVSIPMVEWGKE